MTVGDNFTNFRMAEYFLIIGFEYVHPDLRDNYVCS